MEEDDANERTCYVSNLHEQVTQPILEELFIQMGPIEKVILNANKGYRYSLVVFKDSESVIFASQCLDKIPLYGTTISVRPKGHSQQEEKYKRMLAQQAAREKQNFPDFVAPVTNLMPLPFPPIPPVMYGRSQSDRRDNRNRPYTHESYRDSPSTSGFVPDYHREQKSSRNHHAAPYDRTPTHHRPARRVDVDDGLLNRADHDRFARNDRGRENTSRAFLDLPTGQTDMSWRTGHYPAIDHSAQAQIPLSSHVLNPSLMQTPWFNGPLPPFSSSVPRYTRF